MTTDTKGQGEKFTLGARSLAPRAFSPVALCTWPIILALLRPVYLPTTRSQIQVCSGLNRVPWRSYVQVLIPGISEYKLIWK